MKKVLFIASMFIWSFMSAQTSAELSIVKCIENQGIFTELNKAVWDYKLKSMVPLDKTKYSYEIKIGDFNEENKNRFMSMVDLCSGDYVVVNDWRVVEGKFNDFIEKEIKVNHDGKLFYISFIFSTNNIAIVYIKQKIEL
jgi:hypothetical protein